MWRWSVGPLCVLFCVALVRPVGIHAQEDDPRLETRLLRTAANAESLGDLAEAEETLRRLMGHPPEMTPKVRRKPPGQFPDHRGGVRRAGQDAAAVGGEGHGVDLALVALELRHHLSVEVPEAGASVGESAGDEPIPGRMEGNRQDAAPVRLDRSKWVAFAVPHKE